MEGKSNNCVLIYTMTIGASEFVMENSAIYAAASSGLQPGRVDGQHTESYQEYHEV